jgi:hypothetical protein
MKPGYYIDIWNDLCIRYPNGSWDISGEDYFELDTTGDTIWDYNVESGDTIFIGDL